MIEAAQLVFYRPRTYRDGLRAYHLMVDGMPCGKIRGGQTLGFTVAPGRHWAQARIDWSGSPPVEFEAVAGGQVRLLVEPAYNPLTMWWRLFGTTNWLRLTNMK